MLLFLLKQFVKAKYNNSPYKIAVQVRNFILSGRPKLQNTIPPEISKEKLIQSLENSGKYSLSQPAGTPGFEYKP